MISVGGLRTMSLVVICILEALHLVVLLVLVAVASQDMILAQDAVVTIGAALVAGTGEDFAA